MSHFWHVLSHIVPLFNPKLQKVTHNKRKAKELIVFLHIDYKRRE